MTESRVKTLLSGLETAVVPLTDELLCRCADKIRAHRRIFVYGAGRSGLMLRALAMRLMQAGFEAHVVGETTAPAIRSGDLLILASASGETHSVCHYAKTALREGADLLVITAAADSTLTRLHPSDILIPAPSKLSGAPAMGTLFEASLLLLGDALISLMDIDPSILRANHANLE